MHRKKKKDGTEASLPRKKRNSAQFNSLYQGDWSMQGDLCILSAGPSTIQQRVSQYLGPFQPFLFSFRYLGASQTIDSLW